MEKAITIEHLTVARGKKTILHDLNLSFAKEQLISVIGPNGCGKSTLLKAINGTMPKAEGHIFIGSKEVGTFSRKELARQMAILTQHHLTPDNLSVRELVRMGRFPYRKFYRPLTKEDQLYVEKAIHAVRLTALAGENVQQLSGGEQQRAWLAVLLAQRSPILLLDEPTTYLDIRHQLHLLKVLQHLKEKLHLTLLVVMHDMNQAFQYSDQIVLMKEGRVLASGTPEEVITPAWMKEAFGVRVEIVKLADGRRAVVPTGMYEEDEDHLYHKRR